MKRFVCKGFLLSVLIGFFVSNCVLAMQPGSNGQQDQLAEIRAQRHREWLAAQAPSSEDMTLAAVGSIPAQPVADKHAASSANPEGSVALAAQLAGSEAATRQTQGMYFDRLPDEILLEIAKKLDMTNLRRSFSKMGDRFKAVAEDVVKKNHKPAAESAIMLFILDASEEDLIDILCDKVRMLAHTLNLIIGSSRSSWDTVHKDCMAGLEEKLKQLIVAQNHLGNLFLLLEAINELPCSQFKLFELQQMPSIGDKEHATWNTAGPHLTRLCEIDGRRGVIQVLVGDYLNIGERILHSWQVLLLAMQSNKCAVVKFFITQMHGDIPQELVCFAAAFGDLEIFKALEAVCRVSKANKPCFMHGAHELAWATRFGNRDIVEYLLNSSKSSIYSLFVSRQAGVVGFDIRAYALNDQRDADLLDNKIIRYCYSAAPFDRNLMQMSLHDIAKLWGYDEIAAMLPRAQEEFTCPCLLL